MGKTMVKCLYCNEYFDRNSEPFQKVGRRYAHQNCYDENFSDEDFYKEKIFEFVKNIFGANYKYQQIEVQRKRFIKSGMTNKGIYDALKYYFEVKNGSIERSEGRIGIVPYVYDDAESYYKNLNKLTNNLSRSMQQPKKSKIIDINSICSNQNKKEKKIDMNSLL